MGAGVFISVTHFLFLLQGFSAKRTSFQLTPLNGKMLAAKGAPPESEIKYQQKAQKDRATDKMFKGPKSTYHQHTHHKTALNRAI